ncbi:SRPBCC family protein [Spiractinospora alimapuensis]|uniref:SRPBCC family protein n=1 Tax=Spiractinospora alimapuensis TaxID=2820884 RepID=UPI001F3E75C8|nr:SRPBCC family protein [Spiractinospora alimapuensis]QVQ53729.1 SRPBCC family protein [Spiractinospora alimapuensis]
MIIENTFSVSRPIDQAWDLLTDLERIAPCMPGARLTEVEDETYYGEVRVRLGPIQTRFRGEASFQERDAEDHRAVINARGKDTGGKGIASATITARLTPGETPGSTAVSVSTDLTISGKIAQFGRSAVADVSTKLLTQFAECLESRLQESGPPNAGAGDAVAAASAPAAGAPVEDATGPDEPDRSVDTTADTTVPPTATSPPGRPTEPAEPGDPGEESAASAAAKTPESPTSGETIGPTESAAERGETDQERGDAASGETPPSGAEAEPDGATESEREPTPEELEEESSTGSDQSGTEPPRGEGTDTDDATRRRKIDSPEPEPIDLVHTAGESVTRSLVPIAIIAVLIVIVIVLVII